MTGMRSGLHASAASETLCLILSTWMTHLWMRIPTEKKKESRSTAGFHPLLLRLMSCDGAYFKLLVMPQGSSEPGLQRSMGYFKFMCIKWSVGNLCFNAAFIWRRNLTAVLNTGNLSLPFILWCMFIDQMWFWMTEQTHWKYYNRWFLICSKWMLLVQHMWPYVSQWAFFKFME